MNKNIPHYQVYRIFVLNQTLNKYFDLNYSFKYLKIIWMETTCKIDEDIAAVAKNMTDILLL